VVSGGRDVIVNKIQGRWKSNLCGLIGWGSGVCARKKNKMPLGQARAVKKPPVKRAADGDGRADVKQFRRELKDSGVNGVAVSILVRARRAIGTALSPVRHEDLLHVMEAVKAGRFASAPDEAWMRKHATRAFADPVWSGQFDAFVVDPSGGLAASASAHHKVAAFHVLAEVFCWQWACESGAGASEKAALCPNSLFQAITNDTPTALRLWNTAAGMFVGGIQSPIGFKAGTASKVAGAAATHPQDAPQQAQMFETTGRGGGGGFRGAGVRGGARGGRGGGRGGCNYCRVVRSEYVTDHMADTCPYFAAVRARSTTPAAETK